MKTILIIVAISLIKCHYLEERVVSQKNACLEKKLAGWINKDLYKIIYRSFEDTLRIIKASDKRPSLLNEKIDDAIFLKGDSSECLLIVLQREDDRSGDFGSARMYQEKAIGFKWKFEKSMWFTFDHKYFEAYPENSFDNIAVLARYSVLTQGKSKTNDCEIDEYFWFEYLK
jgi:hypothetical protein